VQIIPAYPLTFEVLTGILSISIVRPPSTATIQTVLREIWLRLGLVRRFFKLFRFFESFNSAHNLYLNSLDPTGRLSMVQTVVWFDVLGLSFYGMYYLLEASIIVDEMQIDGLEVWTPEWEQIIIIEAARFWLFALVCGVFSGLLKMFVFLANAPISITGEGFSHSKTEARSTSTLKKKADGEAKLGMEGMLERLRDTINETKMGRMLAQPAARTKIYVLGRRILSNTLDVVLPASTVGLVHLSSGTIGLAMFVTTILTSIDVWERCGAELAGST
jgi:hypothetical protein